MVQRIAFRIWPCLSCHTLWRLLLRNMVWKIRLLSWQRHLSDTGSCYGRVCGCAWNWDYHLFIKDGVSKVQKSCKWLLRLVIILMLSRDGGFDDAQTNLMSISTMYSWKVGYSNKLQFSICQLYEYRSFGATDCLLCLCLCSSWLRLVIMCGWW